MMLQPKGSVAANGIEGLERWNWHEPGERAGHRLLGLFFLSVRVRPIFFGFQRETWKLEREVEKFGPWVLRLAWKERVAPLPRMP